MSEVRLDVILNVADALAAISQLEARLAQLSQYKIEFITNLDTIIQKVDELLFNLRLTPKLNISVDTSKLEYAQNIMKTLNQLQVSTISRTAGAIPTPQALPQQPQIVREVRSPQVANIEQYTGLMAFQRLITNIERLVSGVSQLFGAALRQFDRAASALEKTYIVAGAMRPEYKDFVNALRNLSATVMMPFEDLAEISYAFATRGYARMETATDVIRPLAIATRITGETLDTMSRSILSLMQAWSPYTLTNLTSLAPYIVSQFADRVAYSFAKSPLEVRWYKDIANYAAPVFAKLGYDINETLGFFMSAAQQIPTAGIAARSARMLLFNVHDIERSMIQMEKYGINAAQIFYDTAKSGGSLADAFRNLYAEISKLPEEMQIALFRQLGGGVRGGMMLAMLSQGDLLRNIEEYQRRLTLYSIGYTGIVEAKYRATAIGQYESELSRQSALLQQLGDAVAHARTTLTNFANTLLTIFNKLPSGVVSFTYGAVRGIEVAGQYVLQPMANVGFMALLTQMGGLASKIGAFGLAATALTAALSGAVAAFGAYERRQMEQKQLNLAEAFEGAEVISSALQSLASAVSTVKNINMAMPYYRIFTGVLPSTQLTGIPAVEIQTPAGPKMYEASEFRQILSNVFEPMLRWQNIIDYFATGLYYTLPKAERINFREAWMSAIAQVSDAFVYLTSAFKVTPEMLRTEEGISKIISAFESAFPTVGGSLAKPLENVISAIRTRYQMATPEIQMNILKSVIGLAGIVATTGREELLRKAAEVLQIPTAEEDMKRIASLLEEILYYEKQQADQRAAIPQMPSLAQLLELWIKGLIASPLLRTTFPALGEGMMPIYRSWVPGRYSETLSVGLTPMTAAYFDAALKPQPILQ